MSRAGAPRRFHAYNVGLLKTGTTSLAGIFSNYRAAHEFMARETYEVIAQSEKHGADRTDLRAFLRRRDRRGDLELDSGECHRHCLHLLVAEFPDAKFIFTIRDCYSWLDSLANYILNAGIDGGEFFGWGREELGLPFDLPYRDSASREALAPHIHQFLGRFADYWMSGNQAILDAVPSDRLMIVRTHEISDRLPELANFVGVSPESLDRSRSHLLKAQRKQSFVLRAGRTRLAELSEQVKPLMSAIFPEITLDEFLAHSAA